jgi:hypothetical protein
MSALGGLRYVSLGWAHCQRLRPFDFFHWDIFAWAWLFRAGKTATDLAFPDPPGMDKRRSRSGKACIAHCGSILAGLCTEENDGPCTG